MAPWLVTRKLKHVGKRLAGLREELRVIDEQSMYLGDDALDAELRALVSEGPYDRHEAKEASSHAAAMAKHREHVVAEIAHLEQLQDELLDRLNG